MPNVVKHSRIVPLAAGLLALSALAPAAQAVSFGDMFNPGRWFGGGDDDYYYDEGPWGPYGGGPVGPYGAPYGYGAPGYAPYGAPGYGYPPAGGYAAPYAAPGYAAPVAPAPAPSAATSDSAKDQEIEALKRRIEQLERQGGSPAREGEGGRAGYGPGALPPAGSGAESWPSAPAFRPMDQY
jgi:hypothetical protein